MLRAVKGNRFGSSKNRIKKKLFYEFPSQIYCHGDLLHTVQLAKIFNDSKTFVDMKLKQKPEITLELFRELLAEHDGKPGREDVRKFVNVSAKYRLFS